MSYWHRVSVPNPSGRCLGCFRGHRGEMNPKYSSNSIVPWIPYTAHKWPCASTYTQTHRHCVPVMGLWVALASRHLLPLSRFRAIHQAYPWVVCVELGTPQPPHLPLDIMNCQKKCSKLSPEKLLFKYVSNIRKLNLVFPFNPFSSCWSSEGGKIPPHNYQNWLCAVSLQQCLN